MAKKGGYLKLGWLISVILCLFLGPIMGIIQRAVDGKWLAVILRLFFGWNLVWLIDFILLLVKGDILKLF
ncbi:MAG: hypothetical protein MJ181_02795 [Treponema sp.]|nr:hypothetical protein [Treponema sp.]